MSNVSSNSIPTFCSSPPIIRPILQEFEVLFQEPKGLPLIRDNRHHIHLIHLLILLMLTLSLPLFSKARKGT